MATTMGLPAIRIFWISAIALQWTTAIAACTKALDLPREQRVVKLIGDSQCEKYDFINDLAWYTSQKVSWDIALFAVFALKCIFVAPDVSRRDGGPL
jgi:hypothetical protein